MTAKWVKCHTGMSSSPQQQDLKKPGMIAHNPKLRRWGRRIPGHAGYHPSQSGKLWVPRKILSQKIR